MTIIDTLLAGGVSIGILALIIWAGKQLAGGVLRGIGQHSIARFLNSRKNIARRDLKKYRLSTLEADRRHPLGFLEVHIDVDALYVPLTYNSDDAVEGSDIYHEIRNRLRTVVLGGA